MTVWYSSYDNDVMSDRAHEEYFNDLMASYDTNDYFESFLEENYSYSELFNFTDEDRDDAREHFEEWTRDRAEADDMYEAYEVRLASNEVEE